MRDAAGTELQATSRLIEKRTQTKSDSGCRPFTLAIDQWVMGHGPKIKRRILDYNEVDCIATRVLMDGMRGLGVRAGVASS